MEFEYAPNLSYEDVGSGHVLYSAPGFPAFPARLALELLHRACRIAQLDRVRLWDPMCGAGGLVTALGLLRPDMIARILATDIDADAVVLARRNLELLSATNLALRADQLAGMNAASARIESARRLMARIEGREPEIGTAVADATDGAALAALAPGDIDIVITDLPYGSQTHWQAASDNPFPAMLSAIRSVLPGHAVLIFASTDRKAFHGAPPPLRSFKHGHRLIKIFKARH